jgi:hypothetical protein
VRDSNSIWSDSITHCYQLLLIPSILTRPFVKEAYNEGSQLPLLITPLHGPREILENDMNIVDL